MGWKGKREGGWEVLHILSFLPQGAFLKLKQGVIFKTGVSRKWTFLPWCVTHDSDGITPGVSTHKHIQNSMEEGGATIWTQKPSTIFPTINFCHLSTDLSVHFSLIPFISPSIPLQSLQSAVSYRIPLQSSDAALQRMESCTCVCNCESVYTCNTVYVSNFFFFLAMCRKSHHQAHTTVMSPANIYLAVRANLGLLLKTVMSCEDFCLYLFVSCLVGKYAHLNIYKCKIKYISPKYQWPDVTTCTCCVMCNVMFIYILSLCPTLLLFAL